MSKEELKPNKDNKEPPGVEITPEEQANVEALRAVARQQRGEEVPQSLVDKGLELMGEDIEKAKTEGRISRADLQRLLKELRDKEINPKLKNK